MSPDNPMTRREALKTAALIAVAASLDRKTLAQPMTGSSEKPVQDQAPASAPYKSLNSNTKWLREAKWGLFTHYLAHKPSYPVPADMTPERWNNWVNSFDTKALADQLSSVRCPYFFVTIGQGGGYYCAPNEAYARAAIRGPAERLSRRDLVADLAAALKPKGIRQCVYLHGLRQNTEAQMELWYGVVREWSQRWGKSVHAWWIDGGRLPGNAQQILTEAMKSGNPQAIVAYNSGPVGQNRDQLMPATDYEDYLAGEVDYVLPTCGYRGWDNKPFYPGGNISGDQLHFLNFLGAWWSSGEPRFANDLVIAWTKHINDHDGAVTWDLPVSRTGQISDTYYRQLVALHKATHRR